MPTGSHRECIAGLVLRRHGPDGKFVNEWSGARNGNLEAFPGRRAWPFPGKAHLPLPPRPRTQLCRQEIALSNAARNG